VSTASHVRRLVLSEFRNYPALDMNVSEPMLALVGENGAGKTNILEALSLFTPGRGLRRADAQRLACQGGSGGYAVSVELETATGPLQLGIGLDAGAEGARRVRIDRAPVSSSMAFMEHCRIVWLTPDNDGLFRGPAGDRRRFLDRLVLAVDPGHGSRMNALEKAQRSRNRLLDDDHADARWLDAIERELAEIAVAATAARSETVARLSTLIAQQHDSASPFPDAVLSLGGVLEEALAGSSALAAEEWYAASLRENRQRDRAAGRTLIGPSASDLAVSHAPKNMPAELCSTGEQKALLVGLVLAHAALVRQMSGIAPLILLDEVAAHLDAGRRAALFARLAILGGQVWMTGTDLALFDGMPANSGIYRVDAGQVSKT
jgi:DNA replication and repair protein RecF